MARETEARTPANRTPERLAPRLRQAWARANGGGGNGSRAGTYAPEQTGVATGRARVDRRTKNLIPRLLPGEVAVIDHQDLDRVAAEGLIRAQAGAVVNAARSISGRYPNLGPLLLAAAGIPLVDEVGSQVMDRIHDGDVLRVQDGDVVRNGEVVASGNRHSLESLEAQIEVAKQSIDTELQAFAENTLEYLRQERHLLTETPVLPDLKVDIAGRHVLVVVRGGSDAKADLNALRSYIREIRPVIVAVDGGADAVLEAGHRPDIIIGDFDSVSTPALRGDAELVVHAFRGGHAPGRPGWRSWAWPTPRSRPPAPARTWPCSWPTRSGPSSSSPSAPTPRWWSSSTRAGRGWRPPSSCG